MTKTKWYIVGGIFLCFVVGITMVSIKPVKAQTTSTTFPVDEAGIAAYVKLDNIENIDLEVVANSCDSIEELGESYVIGKIKVENAVGFNYPHIYVGADGWIVAYYLKTEEASRIMQWKDYTAGSINTTTLKDAINYITQKIGATYSSSVKYYDFGFPDANKMTLIADTNDFYVTVPGILYEASYAIIQKSHCGGGSQLQRFALEIDGNVAFEAWGGGGWCYWGPFTSYDYYDLSIFTANVTHHIVLKPCNYSGAAGTALIYKN